MKGWITDGYIYIKISAIDAIEPHPYDQDNATNVIVGGVCHCFKQPINKVTEMLMEVTE